MNFFSDILRYPQSSENPPTYLSHLPRRPEALGRSESSGSSTKSSLRKSGQATDNEDTTTSTIINQNTSIDQHGDASCEDEEEDDDLLFCINSGMQKSKSEPSNLRLDKKSAKKSKQAKKGNRSNSKSPRNSKIIPGVRIAELKLKPRESPKSNKARDGLDDAKTPTSAEPRTEMASEQPRNVWERRDSEPKVQQQNFVSLTSSDLQHEANVVLDQMSNTDLVSSTCSNLDSIQPPSIMDSLISLSEKKEVEAKSSPRPSVGGGISAKKGFQVPEVVRRALGTSNHSDSSSSASSCISNLDNIKPPTIMDDMDNSILSIESLATSEVADHPANPSKIPSSPARRLKDMCENSMVASRNLNDIGPPSLMDDVTGASMTSKTLVPEAGATYVIEGDEVGQSTCHDVTDVFDDDTLIEPTLTLESDKDIEEAPDLPRDSSAENSPRKNASDNSSLDYYKKFTVPVPDLDNSSDFVGHDTSGYKSDITHSSSPSRSSRQRRKEEIDRFKTHTITPKDLNVSGSQQRSPKTIKQKREEEADRFKTHVITPADIKGATQPVVLSPMEVKMISEDANLIASAIEASKNAMEKSRSQSLEMLDDDSTSNLAMIQSGSDPSLATMVVESPKKGPRILKPSNQPVRTEEPAGIRGRRKPLYSSPKHSNNVVKPAIAPKPQLGSRLNSRSISSPGQNRKPRTAYLRSTSQQIPRNSPPTSPRSTQRRNISSPCSTISNSSSRASSSRVTGKSTPLIRQGTFTKEDSSSNQSGCEDTSSISRGSVKTSPKPSIRRDVIHPMQPVTSAGGKSRSRSPRIMQTKTSQLRENSSSRPNNGRRERNFSSSSNSSYASTRSGSKSGIPVSFSNQNIKSASSLNSVKKNNTLVQSQRFAASHSKVSELNQPHKRYLNSEGNLISRSGCSTGNSNNSNNSSIQNLSSLSSAKKPPTTPSTSSSVGKKEVGSKLASLWKKVEDSKKKAGKDKDAKDPRVWITQGKVIPENELALLRVHQEQQEIISNFQAKAEASDNKMKPRSKSRLSMKLSKFSKGKKEDKNPTSPSSPPDSCKTLEDFRNGNAISPTTSAAAPVKLREKIGKNNGLSSSRDDMQTGDHEATDQITDLNSEEKGKRHSRLGSFLNPDESGSSPTSPVQNAALSMPPPYVNPPNRSPAAAVVPPFNYNPPMSGPSSLSKTTSSTQVRRNDSYVSSMGRKPRTEDPSPDTTKKNSTNSSSSSVLVTLV